MVHVTDTEGFEIHFEALPEDISAHEHFVNECGWTEEEFSDVSRCDWFCAKVSAYKAGIELGAAYLGCCSYTSASDFYTEYKDAYFADMTKEAVTEAKATIAKLCA